MIERFKNVVLLSVGSVLALSSAAALGQAKTSPFTKAIPQGFIQNKGQWDDRALFYSAAPGADMWVTATGIKYDFHRPTGGKDFNPKLPDLSKLPGREGHVVELKFLNTAPNSSAFGVRDQHRTFNFIGIDYHLSSSSYQEARIANLYGGVSLRIYRDQGAPRFDLLVDPKEDPSKISFKYDGASKVSQQENGTLLLGTRFGDQKVADLFAYQEVNGSKEQVPCKFDLRPDGTVKFKVGDHRSDLKLIIDPIIYSTLMGGGGEDQGFGVTVDKFSNPYITGFTNSVDFPTTNGAYNRNAGNQSAFVTKFTNDATGVIFSTVINSGGASLGQFVQVDSAGRPTVIGETIGGIPITANAFQKTLNGKQNLFITRLNATGTALDYSTYYGKDGTDYVQGFKLNSVGQMYFGGTTDGKAIPTSSDAYQQTNTSGGFAGFIGSLNQNGSFAFGSFIGGSSTTIMYGFDIDLNSSVYVAGTTGGGFPTTVGVFDRSPHLLDGFVAKFSLPTSTHSGAHALEFATLLGGSGDDRIFGLAVDQSGNSFVFGQSSSIDFPITPGAFSGGSNGGNFIAKISLDASQLLYCTYTASGTGTNSIAVDDLGFAYVTGSFNDINKTNGFAYKNPENPPGTPYAGPHETMPPFTPGDSFLQVMNPTGTDLLYGDLIGGTEDDMGMQVVVDPSRSAYVVGMTDSFTWAPQTEVGFPTTPGVFKTLQGPDYVDTTGKLHAYNDAFLVKYRVHGEPVLTGLTVNPAIVAGSGTSTGTVTISGPATAGQGSVHLKTTNASLTRFGDANGNPLTDNTIAIPAGQTQVSFTILTTDVNQSYTVQITAELEGLQKVAALTIAPYLQGLRITPYTVTGGNLASGRVDLLVPAPAGGLTINVVSSDPSKAYPVNLATGAEQDSFTIAAGASSGVFDIQTRGVDQSANISMVARIVSPSLAQTQSSTLTVVPANLSSVIFNPSVVNGGQISVGTVSLTGQAGPTPVTVKLSLGAGTAQITSVSPSTLTIAPYSTSASFDINSGVTTVNAYRVVNATKLATSTTGQETLSGTLYVDQISITSINLSTDTILGGGTVTGSVSVNTPAAGSGFSVDVSSSNPTYAKLNTGAVFVQPGAISSTPFTITTPLSSTTHVVTITASKAGYVSKTVTLTVRGITVGLSVAPNNVIGGVQNSTGTVTINEVAPAGGLTFQLASNNPAAIAVPSTITVPANTQSVSFTIKSSIVSSQKIVTVTLSHAAQPTNIVISRTITVTPIKLVISVSPTSVAGGLSVNGSASLSSPAPSNVSVVLSTNTNVAQTVPTTVVIKQGSTSALFTVRTAPVSKDTLATITGTLSSGAYNNATLLVLAPRVIGLSIASPTLVGGTNTTGTVTLNSQSPSSSIPVALSSNNANVTVPSTVNVNPGQTTATFPITSVPVAQDATVTITATYPAGVKVTATINLQSPRSGTLTITPSDVTGGTSVKGTVTIGVPAPSGGIKVTLSADPNATATPYIIMPASVTIPPGAKTVSFTITTKAVSRTAGTTITATFTQSGFQTSATLTLEPGG